MSSLKTNCRKADEEVFEWTIMDIWILAAQAAPRQVADTAPMQVHVPTAHIKAQCRRAVDQALGQGWAMALDLGQNAPTDNTYARKDGKSIKDCPSLSSSVVPAAP